ncbi:unnamed protein product [Paramecium octaurelia]|uniref:Uncharacterized protein n=1 Tax=Paramecium octaurelia TaxID=43137 RepID=A0A8S1X7M3_PAROT|nr:unnamed protein product [Paramecium octaurelia]
MDFCQKHNLVNKDNKQQYSWFKYSIFCNIYIRFNQYPLFIMFQSNMIELEEQLNFSKKNHKQPIQMVILDKNLKKEEHLLCSICLEV